MASAFDGSPLTATLAVDAGTSTSSSAPASAEHESNILDDRDVYVEYRPWSLLMQGVSDFGKQAVFLTIFYVQSVFLTEAEGAHEILVSCDKRTWPLPLRLYCKGTKSLIRSFFLVAASVALVLIGRSILFKYIWSQFLRVGVVLDFENCPAYRDPLVFFVLFEFLLASTHFLLYVREDVEAAATPAMTYFFSPSAAFLMLFYMEYDIEAKLMTLSKYCENSPAVAQQLLGKLDFVTEWDVAAVMRRNVLDRSGTLLAIAQGPPRNEELPAVLRSIYRKAKERRERSEVCSEGPQRFFHGRVAFSYWPTRVLLNPVLTRSPDMRTFKLVWRVYGCLAVFWMVMTTFGGFGESVVYRLGSVKKNPSDFIYVALDGVHLVLFLIAVPKFAEKVFRLKLFRCCTGSASR